jgi:hypothetical protein
MCYLGQEGERLPNLQRASPVTPLKNSYLVNDTSGFPGFKFQDGQGSLKAGLLYKQSLSAELAAREGGLRRHM